MNATHPTHSHNQPPMVRVIAQGIPYYTDSAQRAYSYGLDPNQPRVELGVYNPATEIVTLNANWKELFDERIAAYRISQQPKLRNDPAAKTTRTRKSTVPRRKKTTETS